MKLNLVLLMTAVAYLMTNTSPLFAGFDQKKWEAFVRSELQSVANQVDKSGKAPVGRPLVGDYDTNKDGSIDVTEVKAIKAYLAQN